ncbi:MAG: hypothetical protein KJ064_05215 [Anaerolineae bacterium]|nr:hypothetical protein [Anaerolineae bacterium]
MSDLPHSILEINNLPSPEKRQIYQRLIPDWVYSRFSIDPVNNDEAIRMRCPAGSRAMEMSVYHQPYAIDPTLYINMVDTNNHQLMVLLVVISDPESPRYYIDVDSEGHATHFGTHGRNIPEELKAMEAGLAPGQTRAGLRAFKESVPIFEQFVSDMGHNVFFIEPLAYHNAIIFERYGFRYMYGKREMDYIHAAFQPGGELYERLNDSNPFRPRWAWNSVRGRSWAIHDGILGHPFTGFQMYKKVGEHAGVDTFPNRQW